MNNPMLVNDKTGLRFIIMGLLALTLSLVVGLLAAYKYLNPSFLEILPFHQMRPMHVSLAISWIFLTSVGGIYYYLPNICGRALFSQRLAKLHFGLFLFTGVAILAAYLMGQFGGREYFVFPPVLSIPIFIGWVLFGYNYYRTVKDCDSSWPVYYWMWGTGIVFFFFTFTEAYLYLLPHFRENLVRDVTVQWKSFGAMVGSWNMLVYGTAIYVMDKIRGDEETSKSKSAFALYFLSLTALMFGWAHHAYPVPMASWVRIFAYMVSMAELWILFKIIWDWRHTLEKFSKLNHRQSCRLLFASEIWVLLNLVLALIMSVPALNLITHGTHVTVAHAMGTTIGINSMILLASVFFVIEEHCAKEFHDRYETIMRWGAWITNASLGVFLGALLMAGIYEATYTGEVFGEMMLEVQIYLMTFTAAGVGVLIGLWMLLFPSIRCLWFIQRS